MSLRFTGRSVVAGDLCRIPCRGLVDVIRCNGIAGGPFLQDATRFRAFLADTKRLLKAHGVLFLADRFHEGRRRRLGELLAACAGDAWYIVGNPGDLRLTPTPAGMPSAAGSVP